MKPSITNCEIRLATIEPDRSALAIPGTTLDLYPLISCRPISSTFRAQTPFALRGAAWLAVVILLGMVLAGVAGQINFDDDADGTIINTRYPSVTFANPLGGDIFARTINSWAVELWGEAALDCQAVRVSPSLHYSYQNGSLRLAWHGPGVVLQSAPTLTSMWLDVTRGTSLNGVDYWNTVPATAAAQFYRLRTDCP